MAPVSALYLLLPLLILSVQGIPAPQPQPLSLTTRDNTVSQPVHLPNQARAPPVCRPPGASASASSAAPESSSTAEEATSSEAAPSETASSSEAPAETASSATQSASESAATASPSEKPADPNTKDVSTSDANPPASDSDHYVWAHFMLGNTYPYTESMWTEQINLAKSYNIDGFALNAGSNDWQIKNMKWAYKAAEADGTFKMLISFDFAAWGGCGTAEIGKGIVDYIREASKSPAQAKVGGKTIVSTFLGEGCTFGASGVDGWESVIFAPLKAEGIEVHFVPFFSSNVGELYAKDWVAGGLDWNSAWPKGNTNILDSPKGDYVPALASKDYWAGVSPFFFTHFGADSFSKNWIYDSDEWLYCLRWEEIIAKRAEWKMAEIITWNDYGESSYIGDIAGAFPANSGDWTTGFDHSALRTLTKYYATAFKTGKYAVEGDSVTLWSRPHAAKAQAKSDSTGPPTLGGGGPADNGAEDYLYGVVLATAPGEVTLTSGGQSKKFPVEAGLTKIRMPSEEGSIGATIVRDGKTVAQYDSGDAFKWTNAPEKYNFNYFVGQTAPA